MSDSRKDRTVSSGVRHDNSKPPRRMMIFVITIFIIACLLALAFMLITHPGEPDEKAPAPATEQVR
ncbi:hypothetical protein [Rhizobium sp. R339]|uniref:hypothetical protein n=1 Tax=Rhizobium sp. R339 TaxID=1764273 RepID=UPI00113030DF|nr:hypothetical protein [Rhizobium sp. R339]